jgi:hypothetical protein
MPDLKSATKNLEPLDTAIRALRAGPRRSELQLCDHAEQAFARATGSASYFVPRFATRGKGRSRRRCVTDVRSSPSWILSELDHTWNTGAARPNRLRSRPARHRHDDNSSSV